MLSPRTLICAVEPVLVSPACSEESPRLQVRQLYGACHIASTQERVLTCSVARVLFTLKTLILALQSWPKLEKSKC